MCRTWNGYDINWFEPWKKAAKSFINGEKVNYNFIATGQQKDGRGNIAPTTIILPTLAMEAKLKVERSKEDLSIIDTFFDFLKKAIIDAKDALLERYRWICAQSPESANFMYENNTMYGYIKEEGIESALKHGTLVIGQIGLYETLEILIGKNQTTKEGMALAKKIEQLYLDMCNGFKEEYKLNFGVYFTPAESLSYTAMTAFKKRYGIIPKVSDKEYFTNSMHISVKEEISPIKKIDLEADLTSYSNAGCITYIEVDSNASNNLDALEQLIIYAKEKDIPYFAINCPSDFCTECNYNGFIDNECPACHTQDNGENIQHLRRVTGYLTGNYKTAFNKGKQAEVEDRYVHTNKLPNWHLKSDD